MESTVKTFFALLCLALALGACGGGARTPADATPPPSGDNTAPAAPTDAPAPGSDATPVPPTDAPVDTPTEEPTATPTVVVRVRPSATSSGPLDFQVYVAGCSNAPTSEKPDNVKVTLSIEATGGNGVYRYTHQGVELADKFFDVEWAKSTRLIGRVQVASGDGQSIDKEYDFRLSDHCP